MKHTSAAEPKSTHTFILAGGVGQRLLPLTASRPKPAVSFGRNSRIIDFTLSNCLRSEMEQISVLTQYKHEQLHRHVDDRWAGFWNTTSSNRQLLTCIPSMNGQQYRGTADAVFRNVDSVDERSELILVLSGDHVYQMDYRVLLQQHILTRSDVTLVTTRYPRGAASNFGVVKVDDRFTVVGFAEKPDKPQSMPSDPAVSLVSMGIYVFNKAVLLDALNTICGSGFGFDFGHDIIPLLVQSVRTTAYDFGSGNRSPYWRDVGTLDAYYDASMDLLKPDAPFDPDTIDEFSFRPARGAHQKPRVHSTASVSNTVLSAGVQVEQGAIIRDSVVMPGARIGKGAQLRRTIVEEGTHLPDGFSSGLDSEYDRSRYTVSENGVVVVTTQPTPFSELVTQTHSLKRRMRWSYPPTP